MSALINLIFLGVGAAAGAFIVKEVIKYKPFFGLFGEDDGEMETASGVQYRPRVATLGRNRTYRSDEEELVVQ